MITGQNLLSHKNVTYSGCKISRSDKISLSCVFIDYTGLNVLCGPKISHRLKDSQSICYWSTCP